MTTFSFKTCSTALALSAGTPEINPRATKSWFKMEPPANDRFQKSTLTQEDSYIGWTKPILLRESTSWTRWSSTRSCSPPSTTTSRTPSSFSSSIQLCHCCPLDFQLDVTRSPLDYVGPEFEALLRFVIWRATHWTKGSSVSVWIWSNMILNHLFCRSSSNWWFKVGQEALGISFLSPSSKQMIGLAMIQVNQPIKNKTFALSQNLPTLTQIGLRYVEQRQSLVIAAFSSLPGRPNLANFFRLLSAHLQNERKCALLFGLSYCQLSGGQLMQQVLFSCSTVCSFFATVAIPRSVLEP